MPHQSKIPLRILCHSSEENSSRRKLQPQPLHHIHLSMSLILSNKPTQAHARLILAPVSCQLYLLARFQDYFLVCCTTRFQIPRTHVNQSHYSAHPLTPVSAMYLPVPPPRLESRSSTSAEQRKRITSTLEKRSCCIHLCYGL